MSIILIRGAGDLASGTALRLHRSGYRVLMTETGAPSAVRRAVSFCEAVYEREATVEHVTARLIGAPEECEPLWARGELPLLVDPECRCLAAVGPAAVVDAVLAKRNLGLRRGMARACVALGPGFTAGADCDAVIETQRGHDLGRVIWRGAAAPDTGIPGEIGGVGAQRVVRASRSGRVHIIRDIGSLVEEGERIAEISGEPVYAAFTGLLRGMIREGFPVTPGYKIADIDPRREERANCFTASDKALAVAGGVLEALLALGVLPRQGRQ